MYRYHQQDKLSAVQLFTLYDNVSWTAYTNDMAALQKAIDKTLFTVAAWDHDQLIGLIRVVGDGEMIIYIQDNLVLKQYHKRGIGSELMRVVLAEFSHVRQKVLLTNEQPEIRAFYEKHGFRSCDQGDLVAFAKLKNYVYSHFQPFFTKESAR